MGKIHSVEHRSVAAVVLTVLVASTPQLLAKEKGFSVVQIVCGPPPETPNREWNQHV